MTSLNLHVTLLLIFAQPDTIDQLPELQDWPAFREAIRKLNNPEGVMRTLGCEKWSADNSHLQYKRKQGLYIDIAFGQWEMNQHHHDYFIFVGEFAHYLLNKDFKADVTFDFEVQPTGFYMANLTGWSVAVWIDAYGPDDSAARSEAEKALAVLVEFVALTRPL